MAQRLFVREGQRYAEISRFSSATRVWEVNSIYKIVTGIPHARLVDMRDRQESKTISCLILTNEKLYMLVADTLGEGFR